MTAPKSENPATGSVNGVRSSEQLGGELSFQTNNQRLSFQAVDMSGPLDFALNGREGISAFNSRQIFNVRRRYRAHGGSIRPTPKARHLPDALCTGPQQWVDDQRVEMISLARRVPLERIIEQRGIKLRGRIERVGPCPRCGGTDPLQHQYSQATVQLSWLP
jgi:hypothetical protein